MRLNLHQLRLWAGGVLVAGLVVSCGTTPDKADVPSAVRPCCKSNDADCEDDVQLEAGLFHSQWLQPADRTPLANAEMMVLSQSGERLALRDVFDGPTVLSFFYSRCVNPKKCAAALDGMANLRNQIKADPDLAGKVNIIMVSYDTAFDRPEVLKEHGESFGFEFDDRTRFLVAENQHDKLMQALSSRASFARETVSSHGVQLLLIDAEGRLAREYHSVMWDSAAVMTDMRSLCGELDPDL